MKVRHIQFVFLNPHSLLLIDCHNSLSLPATKKNGLTPQTSTQNIYCERNLIVKSTNIARRTKHLFKFAENKLITSLPTGQEMKSFEYFLPMHSFLVSWMFSINVRKLYRAWFNHVNVSSLHLEKPKKYSEPFQSFQINLLILFIHMFIPYRL